MSDNGHRDTTYTDEASGVTFTLSAETGFHKYLRATGWFSTIIGEVGNAMGYDCPWDELPNAVSNMAYDFAQILLVLSSDAPHPLTESGMPRNFGPKAVKVAWSAWLDAIENDDLRDGLLDAYKEAQKEADDPLVSSAEVDGENKT